jgi:serine/threonine protein kinase
MKPSGNRVQDLVFKLVQALAACHEMGLMHRNLKPDNILLTW